MWTNVKTEHRQPLSVRRALRPFSWALLGFLACGSASAQEVAPQQDLADSMIVVVGAAGNEEFEDVFTSWAASWTALAEKNEWQLEVVGDKPDTAQQPREQLQKALAAHASRNERLWIVLLGHGTFSKGVAKFNLSGPDVSSAELKGWLNQVKSEVIVVDCSSASAPFLTELSAKNRILLTATRSGSEINYARFGNFLAQAITDVSADIDHDESVSLLEAFLAANSRTERFYLDEARLATEHALLDDNGDQTGTPGDFYRGVQPVKASKDGKPADGTRAARVILFSSPQAARFNKDQAEKRKQIEDRIDQLRLQKTAMEERDYFDQLEALLLDLADLYDQAERETTP